MTNSNSLLVHAKTAKNTDYFLQKPVGPLLILGEHGRGKVSLALMIARSLLELKKNQQLSLYPYFTHLKREDSKQDIPIKAVREIRRLMKLKTPGDAGIRRVVLIEDAQHLSLEAQNALLKILEEPNDDSLIILTAPSERALLPTIMSRCQQIWAHPVPFKQAVKFYNGHNPNKVEAAWRLSQGGASLLDALIKNDETHPLREAINLAKSFLRQTTYQRLLMVNKLNPNKEEASLLLEALSKVLAALYRNALDKNQTRHIQKLRDDRKLLINSIKSLESNANSRLVFLNLTLNLRN